MGDTVDSFTTEDAALIDRNFYIFGIIVAVLAIATAARFYFVTWLGERVVADIRKAVFDRLVVLSPEFFRGQPARRDCLCASLQTPQWSDHCRIEPVGLAAQHADRHRRYHHAGPDVTETDDGIALTLPVVLLIVVFMGRKVRSLSKRGQDRVADVGAQVNESLQALNIVQAFTREKKKAAASVVMWRLPFLSPASGSSSAP